MSLEEDGKHNRFRTHGFLLPFLLFIFFYFFSSMNLAHSGGLNGLTYTDHSCMVSTFAYFVQSKLYLFKNMWHYLYCLIYLMEVFCSATHTLIY
jgi:hypothetical protein